MAMNTIDFEVPEDFINKLDDIGTIIKVIGVGGGGGNAVNNMYEEGIKNVDFVVANTDVQALRKSPVPKKIQLGTSLTEGLGAGNNPEKGRNSAKESIDEIRELLNANTKMVFITAGMGGGTGTGAAPVIAQIAREMGILTIGIVTIPFRYEGRKRIEQAVEGLKEMRQNVDALLIIDNEKISEVFAGQTVSKAFKFADNILTTAAKSIADIISTEGLVNVDFADVFSVMKDSGVAVMGTGEGEGDDRGIIAVKKALESPLLNNNDIRGAQNLLVNIYSPVEEEDEITAEEMDRINNYLQEKARFQANMIWGLSHNPELKGKKCSVTVIATAFEDNILPDVDDLMGNRGRNNTKVSSKKEDSSKEDDKNEEDDDEKKLNIEEIASKIFAEPSSVIDFMSDSIVDEYHQKTAYERAGMDISQNLNKNLSSENKFLNPTVD